MKSDDYQRIDEETSGATHSQSNGSLKDFEEHDVPIADESPPRIPQGEYEAFCYGYEKGFSWGKSHVYIKFRVNGGKYDGKELFLVCPYYPKRLISHRHKYYGEWCKVNGGCPEKGQQMSPKVFVSKMFRVLVRDAQPKYKNGDPKPVILQYSVVDRIIDIVKLEEEE